MYLSLQKKQKGVGLIEVLVTMLVLAVGLLGLAALQNSALRFSHTAALESQAQFLIKDIADSMRASGSPQLFTINFGQPAPSAAINCKTTNCSSANALANWSMQQWMANVSSLLPNGRAQIRLLNAASREYSIEIEYDDLRGEARNSSNPVSKRTVTVVTRI